LTGRLFGVGIAGPEPTPRELAILDRHPPRGVILFRRNLESVAQARRLTAELARRNLLVFLDQEGGPVDRLRDLLAPAISFRQAAARGIARSAGELAGEECRSLGVHVDLAPVVDRWIEGASAAVLGDRAAEGSPPAVARSANEFLSGLHSRGVGGCVKHFPGLGRARFDTHRELPAIPRDARALAADLEPFRRTARRARAVMISHAGGVDGMPASLSRAVATGLLRGRLGFRGAAFSDDLEMGALAQFGELPERAARACLAGCDLLFVCSRLEEYPDCVSALAKEVPPRRRQEASARLDAYTRHLARLRREAAPPRPLPKLVVAITKLARGDSASEAAAASSARRGRGGRPPRTGRRRRRPRSPRPR
jgi:beta-N-acetylhexosaminidase